jgi:hypothetical protein
MLKVRPVYHAGLAVCYSALTVLTAVFNVNATTKVFNDIGAMIGLAHVSLISGFWFAGFLLERFGFLYLYKWQLRLWFSNVLFFASALCYQYIVFYPIILNGDEANTLYDVLDAVFNSCMIILGCIIVLQKVAVGLFVGSFLVSRKAEWWHIANIEDSLTFHDQFKVHFDTMCSIKDCYNTKQFMKFWMTKSEENILNEIPEKAKQIYKIIEQHLDRNHDEKISHSEFVRFTTRHGVIERNNIWDLLSVDGTNITESKVVEVMLDMAFSRRRFAFKLFTDFLVIKWIMSYVSFIVIAGAIVFVTNMLGYNDAFGTGFDLFKLYIIVTTYLATHLNDKMRFLLLMTFNRPYNIGDILLFNNEPCSVMQISPGYTNLQGPTFMTIPSDLILSQPIANLTFAKVMDNVVISLPLNFGDCLDHVMKSLSSYAKSHPEIEEGSIRCGWSTVDSAGKALECSWVYNVKIHDRTRYLWLRTRIVSYIIQTLNPDIIHKALVLQAACGGAYNNKIKFE